MQLRIIGYTDSVNECDCCGKAQLKGTYVMADKNDNEFYYGRVCAAKHANWTLSEFSQKYKSFKDKKSRDNEVSRLVEELRVSKKHSRSLAERNIAKNIDRLNINLLNEVFIPLNFEELDPTSNIIIYSLYGRCYNYDRKNN